jgi:CRP/FNR family transcriptional regulator, cyclic AMP receptor protein
MKKILVIEDNDEVRENTAEILGLSSYKVLTAENGKIGVEVALKEKPDLIVCDIMMPVLDGYGVFHLLNKHEETSGIPFIFLTAKSEKTDFRKAMELGADDYLTKPFDGTELLNAIKTRLQKAELLKKVYTNNAEEVNNFINNAEQAGKVKLTSDEREVCDFKKKHTLYSEGQRPKHVYYVVSGKVKTSKVNNDGKELITNIYGAGDFLGFLPILEEVNYTDNAQILENAKLMLIPKEDFLQLITNDLQVAKQFIKLITHNFIEKEEDLLNFAYNSLRRKVAYGLIQLFDKESDQLGKKSIDLTRKNMAHAIGVATESLIRTLADFKDEGLIDLDEGNVQLLNEKKLRNLPF